MNKKFSIPCILLIVLAIVSLVSGILDDISKNITFNDIVSSPNLENLSQINKTSMLSIISLSSAILLFVIMLIILPLIENIKERKSSKYYITPAIYSAAAVLIVYYPSHASLTLSFIVVILFIISTMLNMFITKEQNFSGFLSIVLFIIILFSLYQQYQIQKLLH